MPGPGDIAERLRDALEGFCAADYEPLDAMLAPDFVHTANPLFHREDEARTFRTISERMTSFAERGITTRSRIVAIEEVSGTVFVATMALSSTTPSGEGMSMLAGVVVLFDADGRITHIHAYDTPAAARAAAGAGCCDAHRRRPARAA